VGPLTGARPPARIGTRTRRADRGFTLIEVLVVLVVLALGAELVFANIGSDPRGPVEREAKRLAGSLEHAAALAQWQNEMLGVSAEGSAYRFWRKGADGRWMPFAGDDVLATRTLPSDLTVTAATYAGAPVARDAILPFRASGRNEPYSLVLGSPQWTIIVRADPLNRVAFAATPDSR
jgi:general secretion pathway protein H